MEIIKYMFAPHGDDRGQLVAIEGEKDIPFAVRRVYYIYDTMPGVRRGCHAHRNLQQILLCVHGSCRILLDNGYEREEVLLDNPGEGLYISNDTWREMYDFSEGAVLLVLASQNYDNADYIRDYAEFLKMVRGEGDLK